jgi:hypothetical protein
MEELKFKDDEWLTQIEEEDKLYNDFYYENTENVWIYYLYINKKKELEYIKSENIFLNNKMISKENLLYLLKTNSILNKRKHSLKSIIQYNVDLNPENVINYLRKPNQYNFFDTKPKIQDIKWKDTISLFQDLNCLYILYQERNKTNQGTKKNYRKRHTKTKKTI